MNLMLNEMADKLQIDLTDRMTRQFDEYYNILIEWNKVMNLTGITEYEDVIVKHFIDSLSVVYAIDMNTVETMIDIGTGAGFPGIPLKIAFPDIRVTLLDSLNKRTRFLSAVIDKLELKNIEVFHGRAEEYARIKQHREMYDLCVSRAVSNLSILSEYCLPYVKKDGFFISYKSGDIEEELNNSKNAINMLGGQILDVFQFELPGTDIHRALVLIKKVCHTEKKYPRRTGMPAKEPLH